MLHNCTRLSSFEREVFVNAKKYLIPPGAYVRSADYYWSFNEFTSSASKKFQNSGEYSFGLFNLSGNIGQGNDSINGGPTWYTLDFDQNQRQCLSATGFNRENYTCIANPKTCPEGLSMEVWIKLEQRDLDSDTAHTIVSAGNSEDLGYGGFVLNMIGRSITMTIANGTNVWELSTSLPTTVAANDWFNLAFRWNSEKGLQLFINGPVVEEIPFSKTVDKTGSAIVPADDILYCGCIKDPNTQDKTSFTNAEVDELAFWQRYLEDDELELLTGGIIEVATSPVFMYQIEVEKLVPPQTSNKNPIYELADLYEPCDGSATKFNDGVVDIVRGHGKGVLLSELSSATSLNDSDEYAYMNDELSFSFWLKLQNTSDSGDETIIQGKNWRVKISEGNLVISGRYSKPIAFNETATTYSISDDTVTLPISSNVWMNVAFAFKATNGFTVYINGRPGSAVSNYTKESEEVLANVDYGNDIQLMNTAGEIFVSDVVAYSRYLYDFETYRFRGMSYSENYLEKKADYYWTTDFYVMSDKASMTELQPIYKTINSTVRPVVSYESGQSNKGQAMRLGVENGWVMLALNDFETGAIPETIGTEFKDTCLSDPSLCGRGLSVGLWVKIYEVPPGKLKYTIMSTGEEDEYSRGFSIYIYDEQLQMALADGSKLWKVGLSRDKYIVGEWMHIAFTWKETDGLLFFVNGDLALANLDPLTGYTRTEDRFNRITLGRSNANNNFGNFLEFAFQEVVIYEKAIVSYKVREHFGLIDNRFYDQAMYYWNKNELISGKLGVLIKAKHNNTYIGPRGSVYAANNTISLNQAASILLINLDVTSCVIDPSFCTDGLTVSTWSRSNLFASDEKYILSSHEHPENVLDGSMRGWTIYYAESSWKVTVVNDNAKWTAKSQHPQNRLQVSRWTNLAFTWSPDVGITLFMDAQVTAIEKQGTSVSSPATVSTSQGILMVGHPNHDHTTFIDIFNVAIWTTYTFRSNAYTLTGHPETAMTGYSSVSLMWTFEGPIHMCNFKFSEIFIPMEADDETLQGAAIHTTRDGIGSAKLGNYTEECIMKLGDCGVSIQVGMKLRLTDYVYGDNPRKDGSIILAGAPHVGFEGFALQQFKSTADSTNWLKMYVLTSSKRWYRDLPVQDKLNTWFDLVIGWNEEDGIDLKVDNKKTSDGEKTVEAASMAKVRDGTLYIGTGSENDTEEAVGFTMNDLTIKYGANVEEEESGRCYDTATMYNRLAPNQIFTMEHVTNSAERDGVSVDGAYVFGANDKQSYLEMEFPKHCFSDPSLCTYGFSVSFYMNMDQTQMNSGDNTIVSTGYPSTRGYRIQASKAPTSNTETDDNEELRIILTVSLNDGTKTWSEQITITSGTWTNVAFTWNTTNGLAIYKDGEKLASKENGNDDSKPEKTSLHVLSIGRGNKADDTDFSNMVFDDLALWDRDIKDEFKVSDILRGKDCGGVQKALVAEEVVLDVIETVPPPTEPTTERPQNCSILYDAANDICCQVYEECRVMVVERLEYETVVDYVQNIQGNRREQAATIKELATKKIGSEQDPQTTISSLEKLTSTCNELVDPTEGYAAEEDGYAVANILDDFETVFLELVHSMQLGFDVKDDCTTTMSKSGNTKVFAGKRRAKLCTREFKYPAPGQESEDGSEKIVVEIDSSKLNDPDAPDDYLISLVMIVYEKIDIPMVFDVESFVDLEATTSADDTTDVQDTNLYQKSEINSHVVSIKTSATPKANGCVNITMEHIKPNTGNKQTIHCSFWSYDNPDENTQKGKWSKQGCTLLESNETHSKCCCTHMTTFAVLLEPLPEEVIDWQALKIKYITIGCCGFSLLCLMIFVLVVLCNKSLRTERSMVHLNLCVALILATTSSMLVEFGREIEVFCQLLAAAQHFFYLVTYSWLFMESLTLFYAVLYGRLKGKMSCYAPFSWLVPTIFVAIYAGMKHETYGLNKYCWITFNDYLALAMIGPVLISILFNICVILIIICNLPDPTLKRQDVLSEIRWAVFHSLILMPLLGFIWGIACTKIFKVDLGDTFDLVFTALFCLQGFFVFVVYAIGQRSVRTAMIRRKYRPVSSMANSRLISDTSSEGSLSRNLVDVKPQPLSRPPSSRSSKERSSPRPLSSLSRVTRSSSGRRSSRRSSNASSVGSSPGYIP